MEKKISHRKIYRNAPIIEAVINIRVDSAKDLDEESFEKAAKSRFQGKYPVVERQVQTEFRFPIGTKPQFTTNEQENPIITQENSVLSWSGLRFSSVDGKQILQIGNNCFSFSRLAPYDRWENFKEEAARLFDLYREITVPSLITRSAVRFINRFDFPGPTVDLSDYLKIYPQVPDNFKMKGLALQVVVAQNELKSTLVVSQALIPPLQAEGVSLLLDFDLFNEETRPCTKEIWGFFELLHLKKNEIFESSITDKTRDMIL